MSDSTNSPTPVYRAFISYSHADKAWAEWLHKALETYRVPARLVGTKTPAGIVPRRLAPIFRDRDELASATDLGRTVNAALEKSAALVAICSPRSAQSRWVNEEVLAFKRLGRSEHIFCLIVDGEPEASDIEDRQAEECFCPALRFRLDGGGQPTAERTEPVAADVRPGKDGKAKAKLKLIAGVLGVNFDQLKQREQHRKMQRLVALASLALVVMAVTSVLAVFALISRHEALVAQRAAVASQRKAVVARQAAQRRQTQAEGLVNFMLGDLNDKLRQLGRPDIMQSVDDKATDYFKALPAADVNDTELAQRAKALEKLGSIRLADGGFPQGLVAFRASARISARLAAEAPANVGRQVAYSRTLSFIAMCQMHQGKWADAEPTLNLARQVLQPSLDKAPGNPELAIQMAYLDNNVGHVLEERGQPENAETDYHAMLSLTKRLFAADPDNRDYVQALGVAYSNLGRLALQRGDLAAALGDYRAADAVQTQAAMRHPKDNDQRNFMMDSHARLARVLAAVGEVRAAMRNLQQPIDYYAAVVDGKPRDPSDLAIRSEELASLKRLSGDTRAAGALVARALASFTVLTRTDPSNSLWQQDLAEALTEQSVQFLAARKSTAAGTEAKKALAILEPMLAMHPLDREVLLDVLTARLLQASADSHPTAAKTAREHVLQALHRVQEDRDDPRLLDLQVRALLALDRTDEVRPLVKHLWHSGYRAPALIAALRDAHVDYPPNPAFQASPAATQVATGDAAVTSDRDTE